MTSNQTFFVPFLTATIVAAFMFIGCKSDAPKAKKSESIIQNQTNGAISEETKLVNAQLKETERIEQENDQRIKEAAEKAAQEEKDRIEEQKSINQKAKRLAAEKRKKEAKRKQHAEQKRKQNSEKASFQKIIEKQSDIENSNSTKVIKEKASIPIVPVQKGNPEITFARNFFNFDKIASGDVIDAKFKFTNTGDGPLVIENATATCGCTVPIYSFIPIEPGQTSEITVRFDTKGKEGKQQPIITVFTNSEPTVHKLYLDGEVGPADASKTVSDSLSTKN